MIKSFFVTFLLIVAMFGENKTLNIAVGWAQGDSQELGPYLAALRELSTEADVFRDVARDTQTVWRNVPRNANVPLVATDFWAQTRNALTAVATSPSLAPNETVTVEDFFGFLNDASAFAGNFDQAMLNNGTFKVSLERLCQAFVAFEQVRIAGPFGPPPALVAMCAFPQ